MKKWVLGFVLSEDFQRVVLLRKNRGPGGGVGRLNGPGGKVAAIDPSPVAAMRREMLEETGLLVRDWRCCATMALASAPSGASAEGTIYVYWALLDDPALGRARSLTDEPVGIYDVADVMTRRLDTAADVPLLLCAALYAQEGTLAGPIGIALS